MNPLPLAIVIALITSTLVAADVMPLPTGMLLDLDADHGLTLEDGNRVSAWQNQAAGARAQNFVKRDKGRSKAGSGRPTLRKEVRDLNKHNSLQFHQQELVCMDEDVFDPLTQGKGCTWVTVIAMENQRVGLKDVNSFFGNLKNGGLFGGLWGCVNDDNTLWWGMRNGLSFGRFDSNNPQIIGPKLQTKKFYIIAGRIAAGTGKVKLDLFVNVPTPVASAEILVNEESNPSKMVIGQERDAVEHPGHESFDGEITRFLIFERPLKNPELKKLFTSLRSHYNL